MIWRSAGVVALGLLGVAQPAGAEPSRVDIAIAKKLFEEATQAASDERWQDAREKLLRVVTIKETAGVRFHLALSEERSGLLYAASNDYRRAIELAGSLSDAEQVPIVPPATAALARLESRIPTVTIRAATVPGMRVMVDGQPLAESSLGTPLKHELGEAKVSATAPEREAFEQSVILLPGTRAEVVVELRPSAPVTHVPPPPSTGASPGPSREAAAGRSLPVPGFALAGAAVVLAGGAVYFVVKRSSLEDDTADVCSRPLVICDRDARDARASHYGTFALAAGVGALAAAGAATYFFLRTPSNEVTVGAGPGSARVRFLF